MAIIASAPYRIDLAGGWTDTPPYCFDNGGSVLNLAVDIEGLSQISCRIEENMRGYTKLFQAGQNTDIISWNDVDNLDHDWAIMKLIFTYYEKLMTKNIDITTFSSAPVGSGLGSSSILIGVIIAAVHHFLSVGRRDLEEICEHVLMVEEKMGIGGGWQDPMGGMFGGVKLGVTGRGGISKQEPYILTALSQSLINKLESSILLYYTGQNRVSGNIVKQINGEYIKGSPETLKIYADLKSLAYMGWTAVVKEDINALAEVVNAYWERKKRLCKESTNENIEKLFDLTSDYYSGACLAGAGGGGYAYFICKDATQKCHLRHRLEVINGHSKGIHDIKVNTKGLNVNCSDRS
jgi:fucokinase